MHILTVYAHLDKLRVDISQVWERKLTIRQRIDLDPDFPSTMMSLNIEEERTRRK